MNALWWLRWGCRYFSRRFLGIGEITQLPPETLENSFRLPSGVSGNFPEYSEPASSLVSLSGSESFGVPEEGGLDTGPRTIETCLNIGSVLFLQLLSVSGAIGFSPIAVF